MLSSDGRTHVMGFRVELPVSQGYDHELPSQRGKELITMSLLREGTWVANRFSDLAEAVHIGLLVSRPILFPLYHRDKNQKIFFSLARLSHKNLGKHRESIA